MLEVLYSHRLDLVNQENSYKIVNVIHVQTIVHVYRKC